MAVVGTVSFLAVLVSIPVGVFLFMVDRTIRGDGPPSCGRDPVLVE